MSDRSWKSVPLGEIADVSWGDTKTTKSSYTKDGFTAYSAKGPDGFLPYADYDRVGVVVSAIGAECGKTWLAKGKWSCIKNTIRFWSTSDRALTEYLYWATRKPEIWPRRGSAQPFISQGDARLMPVPLPPLNEQRRIAHILGTLDDKIELNRQMNKTLDEIARTLFRSWFVDFDPVRAKMEGRQPDGMDAATAALFPDRLVDSELGLIPEGWGWGTVGSEFLVTMGQSPPGSTYNEIGEGLPFYQGRTDFGFRYPTERVYCTAPTRFANEGDTLISVRAPVGDSNMLLVRSAIGRGVAAFRHQSGSKTYTYHAIGSLADELLRYNGEGTVFGSINQRDLKALKIVSPPDAMVKSFHASIAPVDDLVESNEKETRLLAQLRDTLLPTLLGGG